MVARNSIAEMAVTPYVMEGVSEETRAAVAKRGLIIALIAFLTLIDLFGSQALLPALVDHYHVSPAAMGFAVNASTFGMAISGMLVAIFARSINRRLGIWLSLALLAIPTFLLGLTTDLFTFALLRVAQGLFMSAAFTLTLTYLAEVCTITAARGAMAAYITGNVASNLFGRLLATGVADHVGLAESFFTFSALNLLGAMIAFLYLGRTDSSHDPAARETGSIWAAWIDHFANPKLRASFAIGFIILFAFVGVFTYVNFVLAGEPFKLPQGSIGLVYFVFVPAILTTPIAGFVAQRFGVQMTFMGSIGVSLVGVFLLLASNLWLLLLGLMLIGAGLFFAQAAATAYVGQTAAHDHAAASGLYLTSYYVGGLFGALFLGQIFVTVGWPATVACLAVSLLVAIWLGRNLHR
ncbi:MAG: MFS transporter [Pseudomonadota bacterium]